MADVFLPILETKDPHYRYKMPKICAKVEGSGNGIKTVITNMTTVAKALGRPPSYPTKYFGCELGAQVTMNSDYVVNGSHDPEKLLNLLYTFIRKFVLCPKCNIPETLLIVSNQTIRQKCVACGHDGIIPKSRHKLTTYIINHPPDGSGNVMVTNGGSSSSSSSSSKGHKASKSEKKSKRKDGNGNSSPPNGHSTDAKSAEQLSGGSNNDDFDDFDDDELTPEAYSERMRELCDGLNGGLYLNDPKENANFFFKLVKEKKEANQLLDAGVQRELLKDAERLSIKDKSTLVLSEILFTENILEEIKTYKMLLLRFCNENKKAQKYLLGGYEKLVGDVYKDKLFNSSTKILKQLYDEDILDEETILEWSAKESKKYISKEMSRKIREKVTPFIKWLKEAEVEEESDGEQSNKPTKISDTSEKGNSAKLGFQQANGTHSSSGQRKQSLEDDDEEEEDDDIDLEFSHRVTGIQIQAVKSAVGVKSLIGDADAAAVARGIQVEDDIDIDNI